MTRIVLLRPIEVNGGQDLMQQQQLKKSWYFALLTINFQVLKKFSSTGRNCLHELVEKIAVDFYRLFVPAFVPLFSIPGRQYDLKIS